MNLYSSLVSRERSAQTIEVLTGSISSAVGVSVAYGNSNTNSGALVHLAQYTPKTDVVPAWYLA